MSKLKGSLPDWLLLLAMVILIVLLWTVSASAPHVSILISIVLLVISVLITIAGGIAFLGDRLIALGIATWAVAAVGIGMAIALSFRP